MNWDVIGATTCAINLPRITVTVWRFPGADTWTLDRTGGHGWTRVMDFEAKSPAEAMCFAEAIITLEGWA